MTRRKGISGRNVIVVLVVVFAIIVLVIEAAGYVRENLKRTMCSASLSQTGRDFDSYALGNNGFWPVPEHRRPATTQPSGEVTYVRRVGSKRGAASQPEMGRTNSTSTDVSTTRAFWEQIRSGMASPAHFVCFSVPDWQANDDDNPSAYWDFGVGDRVDEGMGTQNPAVNWQRVGYGFQVPFGRMAQPRADCDTNMALAADRGPYGAWMDGGLGRDPGTPAASAGDRDKKWRRWNSPNHGGVGEGEGQNVLYPDGRVTWSSTPLAGVDKDNIYTQWSSFAPDEHGRVRGKPPTLAGREVPMGETDTLLYP